MKPWLKYLLIGVAVVAVLYGAFAAFASYSNGRTVNAEIHVGSNSGNMYMKCAPAASTQGVCDDRDQVVLTVHKRDRLHLTIVDDQGGGHKHDFNVEGWQYFLWPASPETELESAREEVTFTAWAAGSYHMLCELPGHDEDGMHGTLVVT
jgi:plastocyanin